ncbi:hypothetical protein NPIL_491751 [Nephila pilipes]|uniref:Uncharacterized protein n=1 Tax=Nephila pilipes TaxID=299642 RepID=A0A8X6N9L8_NEPPI|nr:hypothetical protein NPIL_491751 [Nephila pilipes]
MKYMWKILYYVKLSRSGATYLRTDVHILTTLSMREDHQLRQILKSLLECSKGKKKTCGLLKNLRWEVWDYRPYSSDLSPCDFHAFVTMKESFQSDDTIQITR